ncbi:pyridoxamine 5'-phosphate oxidase family protein [Oscillibacter sp. MSJ-2]|uniref:Pyridoxamine 5'-phosphate oxidase family protein n=1 Tax=Dysosmobacter acutus TaxID=2841504 RepID=A0ABS6FC73_9FIRM|nr:pyridoxamine 5'-phosphate oxidase family protein [Dysosmobacter acutus]MBU5626995.1 pyridoxamine 5'-phosphate oxidase family protein [Dysosmobacter acutus]
MFPELRRKRQSLPLEACDAILKRGTSGVLALIGEEGYPYAVPLSYVWDGEKLYFHCAKNGHKMDAIRRDPRASFCVIDQDQVVPEEYTSYFRSVIVFGTVRILEEDGEKWAAVKKIALKYAPDDSGENREEVIKREWKALGMLELTVDHMTGKEAIELVSAKGNQ